MNLKRTIMMALGCAAVAAWLSAAMAPSRRQPVVFDNAASRPVELSGAALTKEIERLHERLRPDSVPRAQARNLFAFRSLPRDKAVTQGSAPATNDLPQPAVVEPFPLTLVGLAEDPVPGASDTNGGVVRTAVIAGHGQLFLAKAGDTIVDRDVSYIVGKVSADNVELTDRRDETVHRLALK